MIVYWYIGIKNGWMDVFCQMKIDLKNIYIHFFQIFLFFLSFYASSLFAFYWNILPCLQFSFLPLTLPFALIYEHSLAAASQPASGREVTSLRTCCPSQTLSYFSCSVTGWVCSLQTPDGWARSPTPLRQKKKKKKWGEKAKKKKKSV